MGTLTKCEAVLSVRMTVLTSPDIFMSPVIFILPFMFMSPRMTVISGRERQPISDSSTHRQSSDLGIVYA
jgi:hypothetical protein